MFTPIVYFVIAVVAAIVLLVAALVIWLAELIGSAALSALIVGGVFLLISWVIYVAAVRQSVEYLRGRLETIYEVADAARNGYRIASQLIRSFLGDLIK